MSHKLGDVTVHKHVPMSRDLRDRFEAKHGKGNMAQAIRDLMEADLVGFVASRKRRNSNQAAGPREDANANA
jgi:hypothetical protein